MSTTLQQARKLCTSLELKLYEASRPPLLKTHTIALLQSKVERARTLRDKYRDLYKRQRLTLRTRNSSKKADLEASNLRTKAKITLFMEVLQRFQQQLVALKAAAKEAGRKTTATKPKKAPPKRKKAAAKPKAKVKAKVNRGPAATSQDPKGFLSATAVGADIRQREQKTRSKAIMGHKRAAGQRSQARRDARR